MAGRAAGFAAAMNMRPKMQNAAPAGRGENAATSPYAIIKKPMTDIARRDTTIAGSQFRRGDFSRAVTSRSDRNDDRH
jgi:hypothetical protein